MVTLGIAGLLAIPAMSFAAEEAPRSALKSLFRGKIKGDIGPLDYVISKKSVKFTGGSLGVSSELTMRYDNDWRLALKKPTMGGDLKLFSAESDGAKSFGVSFELTF